MNIEVIYGEGAANDVAPPGFYSAVNYVINYLDELFTNNVTININISYGAILDPYTNSYSSLSAGDLGESYRNNETIQSYSAVASALQTENAPGAGSLPGPPPLSGSLVMGSAEAKALGLTGPSTAFDGAIGVSSSAPWDFTPNATPTSSEYYLVGVLEHEITETMGRVSYLDNGDAYYGVADLYRYSAPDVRSDMPGSRSSTAYFSTDQGATNLGGWNNQLSNGDLADWYPHGPGPSGNDAFNDYSSPGVINAFSSSDVTLMQALGWTTPGQTQSLLGLTASTDDGAMTVNSGHLVTISLDLAQNATVVGTPSVQLNDGEVAVYTGGSGTSTLVFTYAVLPADNVSDLQVTGLNLPNGSSISGLSGGVNGDLGLTINSTTSPATVAEEINGLYVGLYGVAATESGLQYWIKALSTFDSSVTSANAAGLPISTADAAWLGQQFALTQASYFTSQYGNDSDTQFVAALYQNITDSPGSSSGVQYWTGVLQSAEAANGGNALEARASVAAEFVHDVISNNLSVGASALGLTASEYADLVAGQAAELNKDAVSLFYATETAAAGGSILNYATESSAAFAAAQNAVTAVTSESSTATVAITGIASAVAHQDLALV